MFNKFAKDPKLFQIYHEGYKTQFEEWPFKPAEIFISQLKEIKTTRLVIADMGCGEAYLAKEINNQHKVHSFDLISNNKFVTACDISKVYIYIY